MLCETCFSTLRRIWNYARTSEFYLNVKSWWNSQKMTSSLPLLNKFKPNSRKNKRISWYSMSSFFAYRSDDRQNAPRGLAISNLLNGPTKISLIRYMKILGNNTWCKCVTNPTGVDTINKDHRSIWWFINSSLRLERLKALVATVHSHRDEIRKLNPLIMPDPYSNSAGCLSFESDCSFCRRAGHSLNQCPFSKAPIHAPRIAILAGE